MRPLPYLKALLAWGLGLLLTACKSNNVIPNNNVMPPPLGFFLLDRQGTSLLTSISTPIRVYAYDQAGRMFELGDECRGGGCTMVQPSGPPYNFFYRSGDASSASVAGTKTWYIELGGKVDTLYYDVQKTRPNSQLDKFDVVRFTFNGEPVDQSNPVLRRKR